MKASLTLLFFFSVTLFGTEDGIYSSLDWKQLDKLFDEIDHDDNLDVKNASLLMEDGIPVGIIVGDESFKKFEPALPDRKKITKLVFGYKHDLENGFFEVSDPKEIDLIYELFERFSTRRELEKKFYRIGEDAAIEEVDLGKEEPGLYGHLCTLGFYFFSGDENISQMDAHFGDENFFGENGLFINHAMAAYLTLKEKQSEQIGSEDSDNSDTRP